MKHEDFAGSFAKLCKIIEGARLTFVLEYGSMWSGRLWIGGEEVENVSSLTASADSVEIVAAILLEKLPRHAELMEGYAERRLKRERDLVQRLRGLR